MNNIELVFLYDISYANPNGDPLDENKPRVDEDVELNIVTDVRLKRTVRDYLHNFKRQGIFVKEIEDDKGNIQDAKLRAEDYFLDDNGKKLDKKSVTLTEMKKIMYNNILKECIDVRLFGGTIPIERSNKEKSSITLTGPVQFRFGRSMHKVEIKHIKGTGAFASGKDKQQKTFREEYVLPYSLISFYGVVNENAAEKTLMTEKDKSLLVDGIWNGTKNLITRSKFGQMPRLLLNVTYSSENFFIGDFDKKIKVEHNLDDDKKLRSIDEIQIDVSEFITALESDSNKIESISIKSDQAVKYKDGNVPIDESLVEYLVKKSLPAIDLDV